MPLPSRRPRPVTVVALAAAFAFVVFGIGTPLLGLSVFAGTDALAEKSPYHDAGLADVATQNIYMSDIYTAMLPATDLFADTLAEGKPAQWNPYVVAGSPLGATPNHAAYSPLTLPRYVLPAWMAPAYLKLFELAVAILGCVAFLRLLGVRTAAGVLAGIIFASSAFMVMWTNWPQTRVAALIPWVFWAAERIVTRRRLVDAVPLAAGVAAMLLGGFPSVAAFTLLTVAVWIGVRLLAQRPQPSSGPAPQTSSSEAPAPDAGAGESPAAPPRRGTILWRGLLISGVGVAGGVALSAIQLLPFAYFYRTWWIDGREQTLNHYLDPALLVTTFSPYVFGKPNRIDPPTWFWPLNMVEASSYVGAAALVLAVVAVAAPVAARSVLPRGAWSFLVAASGAWLLTIYSNIPLRILIELPIFSSNFVGRARAVLGFLLAVLAAVGLEVLLRRRAARAAGADPRVPATTGRWYRLWAWVVVVGAVAAVGLLAIKAYRTAVWYDQRDPHLFATDRATTQLLLGLALLAVSAATVVVLWWLGRADRGAHAAAPVSWLDRTLTPDRLRLAAVTVLFGLVVSQALYYVGSYWPKADRDTYYPVTDTHEFLAQNLGHDRYAGTGFAMVQGTNSAYRLRSLSGHTFVNAEFAALLLGMPNTGLKHATHVYFDPTAGDATSPVLDRLAARYFVTSPRDPVFGEQVETASDGSTAVLNPGVGVSAPLPVTGALRAVGITPVDGSLPADATAWLEIVVHDEAGTPVAQARRLLSGMRLGEPFLVPVAGEGLPSSGPMSVTATLHAEAPLQIAAVGGRPATVAVVPVDDGLALVYAGSSVIYERLDALPRIRWASSVVVEPDQNRRVAMLAAGDVGADEVVLNTDGPAADGRGASIRVAADEPDRIQVDVDAAGAGYLVVADAIQAGWAAWLDGQPAPLRAADQAVVAVAVPAGSHTIEFRYASPYRNAGGWITAVALVAAAGLVLMHYARRRSPGPHSQPHESQVGS